MTDEKKKEYTLRITNANRSQLVVILYEMLEEYIQEAMEHTEERSVFRQTLRKAKGCVRELIGSLNRQYEVAENLYELYRYVHRELIAAETQNKKEPLINCLTVISGLHEAYAKVSSQDTSEALLANTQTVYAGLTYGRDDINESLSDEGINRGFRA